MANIPENISDPQLDEWARLFVIHSWPVFSPRALDGAVTIRLSATEVLRLSPSDAARLVAHTITLPLKYRHARAELALAACEALAQAVELSRRNAAELEVASDNG